MKKQNNKYDTYKSYIDGSWQRKKSVRKSGNNLEKTEKVDGVFTRQKNDYKERAD